MKAVVSLGANLGNREETLKEALDCLNALCKTSVLAVSSFYETEPVEVQDVQPEYINCAAVLETELSPKALLGACLGIEAAKGRVRLGFKTARTLDIDLLLYEGYSFDEEELTVPHPRMLERAFVLVPLSELFPEGEALGVEFSQALEKLSDQRVVKYKK